MPVMDKSIALAPARDGNPQQSAAALRTVGINARPQAGTRLRCHHALSPHSTTQVDILRRFLDIRVAIEASADSRNVTLTARRADGERCRGQWRRPREDTRRTSDESGKFSHDAKTETALSLVGGTEVAVGRTAVELAVLE